MQEVEVLAKKVLPGPFFHYVRSGSDSETTVRDNRLIPRCMINVSQINLSFNLLGQRLAMPVLIAPMSQMRMAHHEGEVAMAHAAAAAKTCMVVSTMATTSLEDVAAAGQSAPCLIFQLYVTKDRKFTASLIQRAEKAGYRAIMVTVDSPRTGNREADERSSLSLREDLEYSNLADLALARAVQTHDHNRSSASAPAQLFNANMDDSLTWNFLSWMRTVTSLPVFVKGVMSPQDARLAVDAGAAGIVVSNHGGRQLDHCAATLDMVNPAVYPQDFAAPIACCGAWGTDVLKALALGADAVLLGRPCMWGLALQGQAGVEKVLSLLRRQLELAMVLAGVPNLQSITRDLVIQLSKL
eukprot:jgi/Astpho2/1620/fgenesh1_pm.00028_%23_12_t